MPTKNFTPPVPDLLCIWLTPLWLLPLSLLFQLLQEAAPGHCWCAVDDCPPAPGGNFCCTGAGFITVQGALGADPYTGDTDIRGLLFHATVLC